MKALVKFAAGEGNIDVLDVDEHRCGAEQVKVEIAYCGVCGVYKHLTVRGSITYTARTWQRMMDIYARGNVRLHDLVSAKLPISAWREAFDLCAGRTAVKVLLYPIG
jgi:threonine dehydrogenase-like Zn-dependent dehydrogenase